MVRPATLPDCLGGNGRISCAPTGNANAATIARLIIMLTAPCLIACLLSNSVSSSHRFDDKGADRVLQSSPKFDEGAKDTACASPCATLRASCAVGGLVFGSFARVSKYVSMSRPLTCLRTAVFRSKLKWAIPGGVVYISPQALSAMSLFSAPQLCSRARPGSRAQLPHPAPLLRLRA